MGDKPRGFGRGLAAEKIIGLRREGKDNVSFLVRWRGTEETDFVNAKEAKAKIPQVVIEVAKFRQLGLADITFCQPYKMDQKIGSRQQLKFHDFPVSHFFNLGLADFDTFLARQSSLLAEEGSERSLVTRDLG